MEGVYGSCVCMYVTCVYERNMFVLVYSMRILAYNHVYNIRPAKRVQERASAYAQMQRCVHRALRILPRSCCISRIALTNSRW